MNDDPAYQLAASRLFLAQEDVTAIEGLVRDLGRGPVRVIDLGAGSGTTALAVLCANPKAHVTTVDRDEEALGWARLNVRPHFPEAIWVPLLADAAAAAALYPARNVNLLLHDAGHGYEDVWRDVRAWLPLLRPGACVWVHDYGPPPWGGEDYPDVRRACGDLVQAGLLVEVGTPGMGWIGRKRP
jgi:predicted O-methyltransferase YrrM